MSKLGGFPLLLLSHENVIDDKQLCLERVTLVRLRRNLADIFEIVEQRGLFVFFVTVSVEMHSEFYLVVLVV